MSVLRIFLSSALAASVAGCNEQAPSTPQEAMVRRPAVRTQQVLAPCAWLPEEKVERILGVLHRPPRVVASAQTPRAEEEGRACLYVVPSDSGQVSEVAVEVSLAGAAGFEFAMNMMGEMFAQELNEGHGVTPQSEVRTDGWDYVSPFPELSVWRVGHVAIAIGDKSLLMSGDKLEQLAIAIRDRIEDVPFALPGADPSGLAENPDPCALLTRAEAESVLGRLIVAPYRSAENAAIADSAGASCSYYTAGHRVLVVTPVYAGGPSVFETAQGLAGFLRFAVGGSDPSDLLEGPWDAATSAADGSVLFLQGGNLLQIVYATSSTDIEGAAKLAEFATGRLASLDGKP